VIESHLTVRGRLAIGGHRQLTSEGLRIEHFNAGSLFKRPSGTAIEAR
jgi:hypothetical protein